MITHRTILLALCALANLLERREAEDTGYRLLAVWSVSNFLGTQPWDIQIPGDRPHDHAPIRV
jgi:hypothetical protein